MLADEGDQADQADQSQHQAEEAHQLHLEYHGVHAGETVVIDGGLIRHHLVQMAHQGADVGQNGLLIIVLGLGGTGFQQVQHVGGGLVNLLVEGLHLAAESQDSGIVRLRVAVEPLAQGAGGGVNAAGELASGIEGVAEVAGPAVVGGFRRLGPLEQGRRLGVGILNALDAQDVGCGHKAEQQHGGQGRHRADPHGSFDAFLHSYVSSHFVFT